jgi:hypothetical protein
MLYLQTNVSNAHTLTNIVLLANLIILIYVQNAILDIRFNHNLEFVCLAKLIAIYVYQLIHV